MRYRFRVGLCLAALIMLALVIISSSSKLSAATGNNRPVIEFETLKHDFGDLFQNEEHTFSFRFKNTGDRPLKIISAEGT
jgi:hypothetical protein